MAETLRAWCKTHGPLNATKLEATRCGLYSGVQRRFGSLDAAAEHYGLPLERRHRRWSRKVIIEEIQRLDREGQRLTIPRVTDMVPGLFEAALRHIGSWEAALQAAGCDRDWRAEDRERRRQDIGERLRAWVEKNGPLVFKKLVADDPPLASAVHVYFGSLEAAAQVFDLPHERLQRTWNREQVLDEIGHRVQDGCSIRASDVQREDANLHAAAMRYFGGWGPALDAAGIDYEQVRLRRPRDPESVAEALRRWVQQHGPLHAPTLKRTDQPLHLAMYRQYGKPAAAAERLGLPYKPTCSKSGRALRSWTAESLLEAIRARQARGDSLRSSVVREDDGGLRSAGQTHFGSWGEAVRAAGFPYRSR